MSTPENAEQQAHKAPDAAGHSPEATEEEDDVSKLQHDLSVANDSGLADDMEPPGTAHE